MTAIHPCPTCSARLEFELVMAGQTIACPECQALVTLPSLPPNDPTAPTPPALPQARPLQPAKPDASASGCLVAITALFGFGIPGCLVLAFLSSMLNGFVAFLFLIGAALCLILFVLSLGFSILSRR